MKLLLHGIIAVLCGCIWIGNASATSITSSFDFGDEDWLVVGNMDVGGGLLEYISSGGNGGGFLQITDSGNDEFQAVAPAKFRGDLIDFNGGSFSFDATAISDGNGSGRDTFGRVTLLSQQGSFSLDLALQPPEEGNWTTFTTPLDAASWGLSPSAWHQVLGGVSEILITLEGYRGLDITGLDNVSLQSVEPIMGDVNGDRLVDQIDLAILNVNLGQGTSRREGDLDGDFDVDEFDLEILEDALGASVPEPGTWLMALVAMLGWVVLRRRNAA